MTTVEIKSLGNNKDKVIDIICETKGWEHEVTQNFVDAIDKEGNLTISRIPDDQAQPFLERLKDAGADAIICDEDCKNQIQTEGMCRFFLKRYNYAF